MSGNKGTDENDVFKGGGDRGPKGDPVAVSGQMNEASGGRGRPGRFLKGAVWSSSGTGVRMLASMFTVMVAVRMCSKAEMGAYFLVMLVSQFAMMLGALGLGSTSIKFLSGASAEQREELSCYLMSMHMVGCVCTGVVLFAMKPLLLHIWSDVGFAEVAWLCVPCSCVMILHTCGLTLLTGHHLFGHQAAIGAVSEILRMVFSILLVWMGHGAAGLLWGLLISRILCLGITWSVLPFRPRIVLRHIQEAKIIKFGAWMFGSILLSLLNAHTSSVVMASLLGAEMMAVFSTAGQLPRLSQRMFESMRPVFVAYTSSAGSKSRESTPVRLIAGLLAIGAGAGIVFAGPLITLLYTGEYAASTPIMRWLCVSCAMAIVNYYMVLILVGNGRGRAVFASGLLQLVVVVVLSVVLVPMYGGVGAAVVLLGAALAGCVVAPWLIGRGDIGRYFVLVNAWLRSAVPLFALLLCVEWLDLSLPVATCSYCVFVCLVLAMRGVTLADVSMLMRPLFARAQ